MGNMMKAIEKQYRLHEVAELSGYKVSTIRKKIHRKELGSRKIGRLVVVPEVDLQKFLGNDYRPAVSLMAK
jgi:excisionase family DNA binding protein